MSVNHSGKEVLCTPSLRSSVPTGDPQAAVLNRRQLAWLRFHAERPHPYRWAWRTADDGPVRGAPGTWVRLRAWKKVGGLVKTAAIHADDRDAFDGLLDCFTPTPAGLAYLQATTASSVGMSEANEPNLPTRET